MDPEQFRVQAKQMVDFIADYVGSMRARDVVPSVEPGYLQQLLPASAPEDEVSFQDLMKCVDAAIIPGMTNWHHPNFHAFYPTAFSFPSCLGSMLSDGFACIGLNWQASPVCSELELLVLDWLVTAMALPAHFLSSSPSGGGVILSSASEATLMMILVERNILISQIKADSPDSQSGQIADRMVIYMTRQAHSSVERACIISLVKYKYIDTHDDETMDADHLRHTILADRAHNLLPLMVIISMGSTSMCSFDSLLDVGRACKELNVKCHVDAAYAGSCLICPEFRHLAEGIELVNSFCFNAHKLLLTHFDCSVLWTDNRQSALQALSVNALYLSHDFENVTTELRHWQIPLGRRFRSLKLWFVLNMFGTSRLQEIIRKHVKLARLFEERIKESEIFELVNKVDFGLVCFRMKNDNEKTRRLHDRLKLDHSIFLTPSILEKKDIFFLRFVCNHFATEEDPIETYNKIYLAASNL